MPPPPRPGGRSFVLRFISGKYQGGEFPIAADKQILIGRSSDLDMVLVEDMVSRKHARIAMQGEQIWIEDLGSTNGTFVNGEKIKRARLKEGDRVLIGTSILKVIAGDAPKDGADAKRELENVRQPAQEQPAANDEREHRGGAPARPAPALRHLQEERRPRRPLGYQSSRAHPPEEGRHLLRHHQRPRRRPADEEPLPDAHLAEGPLRPRAARGARVPQRVERHRPGDRSWRECASSTSSTASGRTSRTWPRASRSARRSSRRSATSRRRELDVLQLAHNYGVFETVLNKSLATDLETAEIVLKLIKAIVPAGGVGRAPLYLAVPKVRMSSSRVERM